MHVNAFMNWEPIGVPLYALIMGRSKFVDLVNFKFKSTRRLFFNALVFMLLNQPYCETTLGTFILFIQ